MCCSFNWAIAGITGALEKENRMSIQQPQPRALPPLISITVSHHHAHAPPRGGMCASPFGSPCVPTPFEPPRGDGGWPRAGQTVRGTDGSDLVHISKADGLAGCLGLYEVNVNGQSQYMTRQQLENTRFDLGAGNDVLLVDEDVKAGITADGGKGDDILIGGGGDDTLRGGKGNDIVLGRGGDDTLHGGRGADRLFGGDGADTLRGGRGRDHLDGGRGRDDAHGGPGRDHVRRDWADLFGPPPSLWRALAAR
jgi:hypothetical protein